MIKKIIKVFMFFAIFLCTACAAASAEKTMEEIPEEPASIMPLQAGDYEKARILRQIIPSVTLAVIIQDTEVREKPGLLPAAGLPVKKGMQVEVLQDSSEKWYRIANADEEIEGWLKKEYLEIDGSTGGKPPEMTREDIEAFVRLMGFPSNTDYFIWTDIARQLVHVLKKEASGGEYKLICSFPCASGRPQTPTTRGYFTIGDRGEWFYAHRFESGAKYWVRFNDTYLFHSVAMDKKGNITDGTLGERRSSGCIRLSVEDAKWIYEHIPAETAVFIH